MTKEKKSLEDKLQEATQSLADEEEKAKGLAKQKAKQDALIADLEERLRNSEKVRLASLTELTNIQIVLYCESVLDSIFDCLNLMLGLPRVGKNPPQIGG